MHHIQVGTATAGNAIARPQLDAVANLYQDNKVVMNTLSMEE